VGHATARGEAGGVSSYPQRPDEAAGPLATNVQAVLSVLQETDPDNHRDKNRRDTNHRDRKPLEITPFSRLSISRDISTEPRLKDYLRQHGITQQISRLEWSTWATRFDIERGAREPVTINTPELPADVEPAVRKYWNGFLLLLSCRWLHAEYFGNPAPFSHKFAVTWCGVTENEAKHARAELVRLGFMFEDGKARLTKLWRPNEVWK
jgi:hypothetical protein